jgi:hypothetical protein
MQIIAICIYQAGPRGAASSLEFENSKPTVTISHIFNDINDRPVAVGPPFVAEMLPAGRPSAAGMLPISGLQFAETLPSGCQELPARYPDFAIRHAGAADDDHGEAPTISGSTLDRNLR